MRLLITLPVLITLMAGSALADWNVGDPYKMHYPQLPKMDGWDVRNGYYTWVADDWRCSKTGPVEDIHLWVSWQNNLPEWQKILQVHTRIYSDIPAGEGGIPYSRPGTELWHYDWNFSTAMTRLWGTGDQGWFDPSKDPDVIIPHDHTNVWQINLVHPPTPYIQQKDTMYWLEVSFVPIGSVESLPNIGWKESGSPHFMDDAVWRSQLDPSWHPIESPVEPYYSMDMAFVITPEPASLVLLALGGLALLRRRGN